MRFIAIGAFLVVICALGQAASIDVEVSEAAAPQSHDIFANKKKLIEDLVSNLCKSAQQAADAMQGFASGLKDQVGIMKDNLHAEIEKLTVRVSQAMANAADRVSSAGGAYKECVESHKKKADQLLNDAMYRTMTCADEKVQEISDLIASQVEMSQGGLEFAHDAMDQMKNCTEQNNNIFTRGACLGMVALKTKMKGAVYMTHSGISVARVDIAIAKLHVALEMCAGHSLLDAGMATAKIIMDLQRCKVSNTFSALTGSSGSNPSAPDATFDISFENNVPIENDAPVQISNTIQTIHE